MSVCFSVSKNCPIGIGSRSSGSYLKYLASKQTLWRTQSNPIDAKSRLCIRLAASCSGFLLAGALPSIDSAETTVPLFADFPGTMLPSDSSENNNRLWLLTFPVASDVAISAPRSPSRGLPILARTVSTHSRFSDSPGAWHHSHIVIPCFAFAPPN